MLLAAGVLKLVDQQVANAVSQRPRGFRPEPVGAAKRTGGDLRHLVKSAVPVSAKTTFNLGGRVNQ